MNHSHLCAQMSQSTFLWWRALRFSRFSLFRPRYPTQRQKLPLGGPQLRRLLHVVTDRGRGVHSGDAPSGPDPGHPDRIRACIRAIRTGSGPDPVRTAIRPDPGMLLTDPVRIRSHPDRIRSGSGAHPIDNWGMLSMHLHAGHSNSIPIGSLLNIKMIYT